eukprot:TRINITY_DN9271_c0_g1_i1.p1 TRINITY_DN9271_c0_g1~~TRINITY_DN9271_c0_g1_i1.p1  ORF type:complete len:293 (+),score=53.95 TRINITY_DN9271_c0_g1_i1:93-971(+)
MAFPCYQLVQQIGQGAQARVYTALVPDDDNINDHEQYVAVKVFEKANAQAAMRSELQFLTAVQGHPNIVRLVDWLDSKKGLHALVLEFCFEDLRKLVSRQRFTQDRAIETMRGVLSALAYVHELDIVHRDVKPDNIAIAEDGCPRLMDLGLATWLTDEEEMCRFPGSIGFAAPELDAKTAYGLPVDVYASGATFYFILGGKVASETRCMEERNFTACMRHCIVTFDHNFDHVNDQVKETITWLMHMQASQRPSASRALLSAPFDSGFVDSFDFSGILDNATLDAEGCIATSE